VRKNILKEIKLSNPVENDWQGGGKGAVLDMMNSKVFEDLTFELRLRL
jgi:hypothetical protein